MTKFQIDQIKKFFTFKDNKARLIQLMKNGEYVQFDEEAGFVYDVKIGEATGDVMLRVILNNGEVTITDHAYIRQGKKVFAVA